MKDIERKVTEFLKDDAADAHHPAQLPDGMTRRIRRHQTRTALITAVATLAIVAVSIAGFRTFLPLANDKETPAGPGLGGVPTTTAALSYGTVSYPSDWHLVEMQGIVELYRGPDIQPVLQLTNWETGVTTPTTPALCWGASMSEQPETGVALVVLAGGGGADGPGLEPGSLQIGDSAVGASCSNPEAKPTATWTWNGVTYRAFAWANDGATEADKATLLDSFRSLMSPTEDPRVAGRKLESPADVLFAGDTGQDEWRIVSYPSAQGETTIEMRTGETVNSATSVPGTPNVHGEAVRLELAFPRWPMAGGGPTGTEDLGPAVLYGAMMPGVETIEVRTDSGSPLPARRQPFPAYGSRWDAFAIPMDTVPLDGSVVALDANGSVVLDVKLDSLAVFSSTTSSSSDDPEGVAHMALLAADTWFADHGTYEGFTVQEASKIDPSLNWTNPTMNVRGDTVDITVVTADSILANAYPKDWTKTPVCAAQTRGGTFVESIQATKIADCTPAYAAQTHLRNALAAAKTFFTDGDTYEGLTPEKVSAIEPSVTFNSSPAAVQGEASIRLASTDTVLLVTRASNGNLYCITDTAGKTTYGTSDANTVAECNLTAWPALSSPPVVPTPYPSVDEASRLNVHAKGDLRYAQAAAKTYFTDHRTYEGLKPVDLEASDPARTYGSGATAEVGIVALRETTATTVLLVTRSETGQIYCLVASGRSSELVYGDVDAMKAADCKGGWPI